MDPIGNRTFNELRPGDNASLTRTFGMRDVGVFAAMSGDDASVQDDTAHAVEAHGLWGSMLVSTVLGMRLPGPGTIERGQCLRFHQPVRLGDTVTVTVMVKEKIARGHRVTFGCQGTNQRGETVIAGTVEVIAPTERNVRQPVILPEIRLVKRGHRYEHLMEMAHGLEPLRTAVVHPVDPSSLLGVIEAAKERLITPVLVGPEQRIRAAAAQAHVDLAGYTIVSTEHSDAAATTAVAMARAGRVEALMKGSLHTHELMHAVIDPQHGLRTGRRMSHIYAIDAPGYPRPLFMTDAVINIAPSLEDKRDIVQNAIDLAHALGIAKPRVAILSAVETVSSKIRSTLDAAALCKMAERGQITGGVLDGPLAFDTAVSEEVAKAKGIVSSVAGRASILIVPDLEAGNMLAKQLEYLANAEVAGIVLGARVPIILMSPADRKPARLGSCAVALLHARHEGGRLL